MKIDRDNYKPLTLSDFIEYAVDCGREAAYNLLLLAGYDDCDFSYKDYNNLMKMFSDKSN